MTTKTKKNKLRSFFVIKKDIYLTVINTVSDENIKMARNV